MGWKKKTMLVVVDLSYLLKKCLIAELSLSTRLKLMHYCQRDSFRENHRTHTDRNLDTDSPRYQCFRAFFFRLGCFPQIRLNISISLRIFIEHLERSPIQAHKIIQVQFQLNLQLFADGGGTGDPLTHPTRNGVIATKNTNL